MTLARRAPKTWSCRCGHRNEPAHRKCRGCGKQKPPRRVTKHARVLRDTPYESAAALSATIHGGQLDACGVCGKPRGDRNHDRDHDHRTGQLRGIACWKCNRELLRGHTEETLEACLAYLRRARDYHEANR